MTEVLAQATDAIEQAARIVLAGHVNPDGDTLGCTLALTHLLKHLGKDVVTLSADGVPEIYAWLPGAEWVQRETERRDFDLAIVCDAGALDRVGKRVQPTIESAPLLMDIDHHVTDGMAFGQIRLLDSTSASTAEIVWKLVETFRNPELPAAVLNAIADCLLTGIVTDTGAFRFQNVRPETLRTAAELQELGASPARISETVFDTRSYSSLKLLGRALASMQISADGKLAWSHITAQDFADLNASDEETEGIVTQIRSVAGVQVGILFREIPGKKVRISLRAREGADVNKIANVFGGGGHRLAAGCSLEPPLADVEAAVLAEAARQLG